MGWGQASLSRGFLDISSEMSDPIPQSVWTSNFLLTKTKAEEGGRNSEDPISGSNGRDVGLQRERD